MFLMPGSSAKTKTAMMNSTITGPPVHASSSFVAPWIGAPSSNRPLPAAVFPDECDEQPLDEDEDRDREDRDEEVARPDPVGVLRLRHDGCELRESGRRDDRGDESEAGRDEETSHRLPFYERGRGSAPGNARAAARRRRPTVRRVRERRGAARGTRLLHRRPHPRLRTRAQDRGQARLLALALAVGRGR